MNVKSLWDYMQVDMEADKFENGMRQSETRQKLLKSRDFIKDQQNNMKKLESDIAAMQDRLEALSDGAARLEAQLAAVTEQNEKDPPKDREEAEKRIAGVQKLLEDLTRYEKELARMRKDAETKDRQQKDIRLRAAKSKQEYDSLKVVYEKEKEEDTRKLQVLRAKVEKEKATVDPQLLARYEEIKQHVTPPMARLVNGQCSGCFMNLPSASLLAIRNQDRIVECDNCGRMIFSAEQ